MVAVEPFHYPVYSEALKVALIESALFDRVEDLGSSSSPTLIARVERPVSGQAIIPLWTALSLGIIPTIVTETHGYYFSLRKPGDAASAVVIDATYSGKTILGWLGLDSQERTRRWRHARTGRLPAPRISAAPFD